MTSTPGPSTPGAADGPIALPEITETNAPFWNAAAEHRLIGQHCPACERYQHEPIEVCPKCFGLMDWRELSGLGRIHTFTVIHQVYHPKLVDRVPYNVSIVELQEGSLMVTNVVDCPNEALAVGLPVRVVFDDIAEGVSLPKFVLIDEPIMDFEETSNG